MVDPEVARLSRETDPVVIGQRIRNARIAVSLTQEELGEGAASGAYVSRIEAGNRRAGLKLLTHISEKVGVSVEQLVAGPEDGSAQELGLTLDYAELALKSGDADAALSGAEEVLGADPPGPVTLRARAVRASALEVRGDYQAAIVELERLIADAPRDLRWIGMVMVLSRCYRTSGDLARAVEVGTEAAAEIVQQGLAGTEEAIRLTLTVATAHLEQGEVPQAHLMCQQAVEDAEAIGSDLALASAYWNSSIVRSLEGDIPGAVQLAERAIASFETGSDARSLAILRGLLAQTQLRLDPPDLEGAEHNIAQALEGSTWSDASKSSRENLRVVSAKVLMARGRLDEAHRVAEEALQAIEEVSPSVAADACVVLGRVALLDERMDDAIRQFRRAVLLLTGFGADRQVAQCWFELGTLLEQVGEKSEALDAFRRAAASTGLAVPDASTVRV